MYVKGEMHMKRYMNASLLYAALAMAGGVFYREFTKFNDFTARTSLGVSMVLILLEVRRSV